jgi:ferrous iron transport protein A
MKTCLTISRANRVTAQCETCPLNRVEAGVAVRIKKLCASPDIQIRLRELGFCEEQIIRLLTTRTNYICQVCNTRLALSGKLADLILVEPLQAFGPAPDRA